METIKKDKDLVMLIIASFVQLSMMFVMFFVRFKQFSIIRFFLIPMLIMQLLAICLVVLRICKSSLNC